MIDMCHTQVLSVSTDALPESYEPKKTKREVTLKSHSASVNDETLLVNSSFSRAKKHSAD